MTFFLSFLVSMECFDRPRSAYMLIVVYPTSTIELKDNTVIVVLGASGDLAKKKTVRVL